MVQRRSVVLVLLAAALLLAIAVGYLTAPSGAESRWSSDFGPLTLRVAGDGRVSGTYQDYDGRIDATYHPELRLIAGYWLQPTADTRCAAPRDGTDAWGRVEFSLEGGDRLLGVWAYCDGELDGRRTWDARFLGGTHPQAVSRR